jgi:hypothetical protein
MRIDLNGTQLWFDVDGPALMPDGSELRQQPAVVLVLLTASSKTVSDASPAVKSGTPP